MDARNTNTGAAVLTYNSTTTLKRIRAAQPCSDGWTKLLRHLGKDKADDEPLPLLTVLDSNGLDDALWVLSYAMPDDRLARHFQAWCAEQVSHLFEEKHPGDTRIRDQIAMLRNDGAADDERDAARRAAWGAAGSAEQDTARVAASPAAWCAARTAACGAAWAKEWGPVWNAAWNAVRDEQKAQLRKMIKVKA